MLSFLDIPQDILLIICSHILPQDVLALKQTCRVLHAFGCMDYLWHQFKIDLPLDLPQFPHGNLNTLSSSCLQSSTIKALKLDRNWRNPASQVRRLIRIPHGDIVYQLQLLGPKWLVTLSRSPTTSNHLSLWRLPNSGSNPPRCVATSEISPASKLAACLQDGETSAIIAILGSDLSNSGHLSVFSASLDDDDSSDIANPLTLITSIPQETLKGVLFDVRVSGPMVACAVAFKLSAQVQSITYKIFLFNTSNNVHRLIDPKIPLGLERVRFNLYPHSLLIAGIQRPTGFYVTHISLPQGLFAKPTKCSQSILTKPNIAFDLVPEDVSSIVVEHKVSGLPDVFEFDLSPEPFSHNPSNFSVIVFHSFSRRGKGLAAVFQFSLCLEQKIDVDIDQPSHTFPIPVNSYPEFVCMGKTGYRAVWLEHRWDTDEFRLMKASLTTAGGTPTLGELLPRHLALPFEPHTCRSLAFEESSGRVCLGLHTGDIYILEF